jgi:hypothetical protein
MKSTKLCEHWKRRKLTRDPKGGEWLVDGTTVQGVECTDAAGGEFLLIGCDTCRDRLSVRPHQSEQGPEGETHAEM